MLFEEVYDSPAPIRSALAEKWWHENCTGELTSDVQHVLFEAEGQRRRIVAQQTLGRTA